MKKILLFSLFAFSGFVLKAQDNYYSAYYDYGYNLYYADSLVNPNSAIYFNTFLFPDSTVKIGYLNILNEDSSGSVSDQSIGEVLDPTDPYFGNLNTVLNTYVGYTVDTVLFGYNYQRVQEQAPDTVVIQIYNNDEITFNPNPGFANGASYATVGYNCTIREGANAIRTDKILLTDNDTITMGEGFVVDAINMAVPAGEKIAATITYIPGNPYKSGDTLDWSLNPRNRINSFQVFEFQTQTVSPGFYNDELDVDPSVRYNYNSYWDSLYIPGTAWIDGIFNLDASWYIRYDSTALGVKTPSFVSASGINPNPVCDNCSTRLNFSLENDNDLTIDVFSITGVKVLSMDNRHFSAGNNNVDINSANLSAGVYICNIKGTEVNQSLKMVVQ